jgi:hypothetical protein
MPERIQQRRSPGWRKPENTVSVARPGRYGNPFRIGEWFTPRDVIGPSPGRFEADRSERVRDRAHAVELFREWLSHRGPGHEDFGTRRIAELAGKNLMCFCPLDQPCHADVLLEIANATPKENV